MLITKPNIKWPNVPDVYNWLTLDNRGNWLIKREKIHHQGLIDFINAHYTEDKTGRWFFQNGPQRVFVSLKYTPYVLSIGSDDTSIHFKTQTNEVIPSLDQLWLDNHGRMLGSWNRHIGLISDRDLPMLIEHLAHKNKPYDPINASDLEKILKSTLSKGETPFITLLNQKRYDIAFIHEDEVHHAFHFNPHPTPPDGSAEC
ncbi:MAG: DUF2946 family protein [Proteobacteria bacterium]|nr:DUF2946 family protein [Pseudomonadota bacterium]